MVKAIDREPTYLSTLSSRLLGSSGSHINSLKASMMRLPYSPHNLGLCSHQGLKNNLFMRSVRWAVCVGISGASSSCSLETQSTTELNAPPYSDSHVPQRRGKILSSREASQKKLKSNFARARRLKLGKTHSAGKDQSPVKVEVERLSVARDVKQRRVIGVGEHFPHNIGSIWSLAEVYAFNGTAELEMRWWRGEQMVSVSPFLVSEGLRWREWSKLNIKPSESGSWRVEVYQPSLKRILMSQKFQIEDPLLKPRVLNSDGAIKLDHEGIGSESEDSTIEHSQSKDLNDSLSVPNLPVINRFKIARQIKRRRPIDTSSRFSLSDERLWGYIEVSNLESPSHVWMEWYHEESLRSKLKVRVGVSKRWRTWSWQRLSSHDKGQWSVKVYSMNRDLIAETYFTVVD